MTDFQIHSGVELIPDGTNAEQTFDWAFYFELDGTHPKTNEVKVKKCRIELGDDARSSNPDTEEEFARIAAMSDVRMYYPSSEGWIEEDVKITFLLKAWEVAQNL